MHYFDIIRTGILFVYTSIAVYTDIKYQKIFNKLNYPVMLIALIINSIFIPYKSLLDNGIIFSLSGLILGVILLIIPFYFRGIGGGDVKLFAGIGALMGPVFTIHTFLYFAIIWMVMTLIFLIKQGNLTQTLKDTFISLIYRTLKFKTLSSSKAKFPIAVAIFSGTIVAYLRLNLNLF